MYRWFSTVSQEVLQGHVNPRTGHDETRPRFARVSAQQIVKLRIQVNVISLKAEMSSKVQALQDLNSLGEELIGSQHLSDLHELIRVVVSMEERLLAEDLLSGTCYPSVYLIHSPCLQTCNPKTTYPSCSRTPESPPTVPAP